MPSKQYFRALLEKHRFQSASRLKALLIQKRAFDIFGSVIGLIALSPLLIATAILVKITSKGPVFYTQRRVGRNEQVFRIIKFRSMRTDAEKDGPVWASKENDHRLTPIGDFLRRSHIDELPQLFNILIGSMSFVGPRPERPFFVEKLERAIPNYKERHIVRPGLTGLAQMNYQYDQSIKHVRQKLRYDLLYVQNISLLLDFKILLTTISTIVTGRGK